MQRHQLYDAPVPSFSVDGASDRGSFAPGPRTPTIKYATEDVVHKYNPTSSGAAGALHEVRDNHLRSVSPGSLTPIAETGVDGLPLQHPRPQHALSSASADLEAGLRSAPATTFAVKQQLGDPFADSPATAHGSTFTISGASTQPLPPRSRFSDTGEDESQASKRQRGPRPLHSRKPSDQRYPRTASQDDKEESISLVRSPSVDGDSSTDDDDVRRGGIRLVEPSAPGRF